MAASSFRDQLARDFDAVFINRDEFGVRIRWNDTVLDCVRAVVPDEMTAMAMGVNNELLRVLCKEKDLRPMPVPGEDVMLDGKRWKVTAVQNPIAHLVIDLERNVS